ncbi:hypothetical protein, partial [Pseudomonas syringae group genomosp. 7]|uniref:hypothetical protein n=1 Tax=Pseudomonas syringae group genomosp. 7 TaxID=251699 RepID=UPI00377037C8
MGGGWGCCCGVFVCGFWCSVLGVGCFVFGCYGCWGLLGGLLSGWVGWGGVLVGVFWGCLLGGV